MKVGIVGLPNVGKSTLFHLLTKQPVVIANYPFATIDPNVGITPVPDERLEKLASMSNSAKKVPAIIEFYDIAGLVKGAYKGEGLGNQFLSHIREVQAIVHVVRLFRAADILHVENDVDPLRDINIINTELMLKDLETVSKRKEKLEGEARTGKAEAIHNLAVLKRVEEALNGQALAIGLGSDTMAEPLLKELFLLTAKPQIYLLNGTSEEVTDELKARLASLKADYVVADLQAEQGVGDIIRKAYAVLGLISFLTTGEDETRAWTIRKGIKAPEAAGVIHTDFEKKFIRAEVIGWEKLLEATSWQKARQKGWLRVEGKHYEVQDGDVIEFKI